MSDHIFAGHLLQWSRCFWSRDLNISRFSVQNCQFTLEKLTCLAHPPGACDLSTSHFSPTLCRLLLLILRENKYCLGFVSVCVKKFGPWDVFVSERFASLLYMTSSIHLCVSFLQFLDMFTNIFCLLILFTKVLLQTSFPVLKFYSVEFRPGFSYLERLFLFSLLGEIRNYLYLFSFLPGFSIFPLISLYHVYFDFWPRVRT